MKRILFIAFLLFHHPFIIAQLVRKNDTLKAPIPLQAIPYTGDTPSSSADFELWQSYPNPAYNTVTIAFSLNQPSNVLLALYGMSGNTQQVLIDNDWLSDGLQTQEVDVSKLIPGVYIYRMVVRGQQKSYKLFVVK